MIGINALATGRLESADPLTGDVLTFVDLSGADRASTGTIAAAVTAAKRSHRVLVGLGTGPDALLRTLTCTLGPGEDPYSVVGDADRIRGCVDAAPQAAYTLAGLMRIVDRVGVHDGLVAESMAYSTLLGGAEFARWLTARPVRDRTTEPGPPVLVDREGDRLTITLNRPHRRNALNAPMRDALVEALTLASVDETIADVVLTGAGPGFCSGGDLDEFGTATDTATAHLVRTLARPAALLHRLGDRATVRVHGTCLGAGIEMPSFATTVIADPDATFGLPELGMGLVPGAGGTVGLTRRIGRWRTAWLVLSGERLRADEALDWGLVDGLNAKPEAHA